MHTQEPWTASTKESPEHVFHIRGGPYRHRIVLTYTEPDATRIVACVNACSGMEDPAAELTRLRQVEGSARTALVIMKLMLASRRVEVGSVPEYEALRSALEG